MRKARASHSAAHLRDLPPLTEHRSLAFMERVYSSSVAGASLLLETKEFGLISIKHIVFVAHCCVLTLILSNSMANNETALVRLILLVYSFKFKRPADRVDVIARVWALVFDPLARAVPRLVVDA